MKSIRHYFEYILVYLLLLLVRPLPHDGVVFLGRNLGSLVFHFSKRRKKSALTNLNIMFSDSKSAEEKKRIIKKSFQILAVSALQSIWVTTKTEERVRQLIPGEPTGLDTLRKCLEKQKGIFFLTAHYGNWEIMGLHHGLMRICPLSSIVRKLDNPYLDKIVAEMRTATGNKVFYRDDSLIKIVRELKNNNSVAIMMDQNTAKGGLFVDFFGLKAATPRAVAQLSYRMGTPVIPLFSYPTETGTYNIEYGPELIFEKSENKEKDILNWTQKMETFIESVIRENPSPWMCGHRRWKTRPPDEKAPPVY
ncbi:MAG: lysophospholipid acyltransferase family protein [Nitrospinae bacterium]|nr:lysophospholipid acyltransferase family protein [Nitrospinota bacterium]MZH03850.1 lysophospholipid acyltransferase family protein [Nitrospinota bacterium]MZH14980.1 lysophospholipid acyltransferase family protein [Nitrospinota bacterium]